MRAQRLSGEEWQRLRHIVLARDHYRCVSCGAPIAAGQAHIHHVVPLSAGGSNEAANLVSLCPLCHAAQHPNQGMGWNLRRQFKGLCYHLARLCDQSGTLPEQGNFDGFLRVFGKRKFRAGQLPAVLAAMKGQSFLFVSPTGSGKSLCFQLPALMRRGYSVVICPLKALMADQVSHLLRQKIPAEFINSDLPPQARANFYSLLQERAVKLAYMTPERFFIANDRDREKSAHLRPDFLIIDEAHCIDRWGAAFRPEYGRLREVRKLLGNPPVLAFTATAGAEMRPRIMQSLGIEDGRIFVRDVDRPNIALLRVRAAAAERSAKIAELLALPALADKKVMIFVPSVKIGKMLAQDLAEYNLHLPFYHANAGNSFSRQELVKRFQGESWPELNWIICTKAFGMGLDIDNVRLVIHWQQSASAEDYLQEYGRAGRDGKQAAALVFYGGADGTRINKRHNDISLLEFMAEGTARQAAGRQAQAIAAEKGGISEEDAAFLEEEQAQIADRECKNIEDLQAMIDGDFCFRRALSAYFKTDIIGQVKKRSFLTRFALWLVDRLYAEQEKPFAGAFCCDYCEKIKQRGAADPFICVEELLGGEKEK